MLLRSNARDRVDKYGFLPHKIGVKNPRILSHSRAIVIALSWPSGVLFWLVDSFFSFYRKVCSTGSSATETGESVHPGIDLFKLPCHTLFKFEPEGPLVIVDDKHAKHTLFTRLLRDSSLLY